MAPCSFMSQAQPYAIKNHRTRPALISTSQTTQKDKIHVSENSIFAMFSTVRVSQFPLDSRRGPFARGTFGESEPQVPRPRGILSSVKANC